MFAARLRAYAPGGTSLGLLPDPLSWQASIVHGDLGALTVTYSTLTAGGPLIERPMAEGADGGLEVALEVWDGATWVEPRGSRFVRVAQGSDTADDMEVYSITFRSYGWLLMEAPLIDGTFTDGRRVFTAPTSGGLLQTILAENAADGGIPLTLIGGGATDAGGATWPTLPDQGFDYGVDYLGIVRGLQEAGALDWATQARGLYAYLPDSTTLSPDLSASVRLHLGLDVGQAPADETIENMLSGVAVRAQAGGTVVVDDPAAPTPWGKWRRLLSVGQVDNQSAAEAMGEAELERSGRAREQYTRELVLHDDAPIPLIDYWPGAWVTAPTSVAAESVRVQQVTLTFGDGGYGGNVVLNDRLVEADIRRARTLGTLAGGQVGSGGAPAPISVDPEASRVPSTPTGFSVGAALDFVGPIPRGVVTASWDAVTTGTDTGPMTISGYELQWRIGAGDWQSGSTAELSAQIRDLTPGDSVDSRVRAVGARATLPSAWTATQNVVVPGDVTPPSVPSLPTVDSRLGTVSVTWDGLSDTAQPMEADFARVQIAMEDSATPTTVVGFLTAAGTAVITEQVYGSTVQVRLRSVDTSGNASAWSAVTDPIEVKAVTGPDLTANSVTANAIAAGTIKGQHLAGEIVLGSTITTAEDGQRVVIDQQGLRLYDDADVVRVDLPTTPGDPAQFRGQVEADGLVVRDGATFHSPWNEFGQDSTVNLAEKVIAPAEPTVYPVWERITLERTVHSGPLGDFALDATQVIGTGRDFRSSGSKVMIFQKVAAGTRIWFYEMDGSLATGTPFDDWSAYTITGGVYTDALSTWFGQRHADDNWYFHIVGPGDLREYVTGNVTNYVAMGYNGTDYLVCDRASGGYRFRRVDISTNPVTVLETVASTAGIPAALESYQFAMLYKGAADWGSDRWVIAHASPFYYRVYNTSGVYQSNDVWTPPGPMVGGFWNAADSRFYTVTSSGHLWRHSDLNWSDPADDHWYLGQAFVDTNATGGTHTTEVGTVLGEAIAFTPRKRAIQRVDMQAVPYSGEADDPNGWQLWGKRGTAPAGPADLRLQASDDYTTSSFDMDFFPLTAGGGGPTVNTFPDANPATLRSARTFSGDPTTPLFRVKGDGTGGWGPLRIDGETSDDWAWRGNLSQWNTLTLETGWSHVTDEELQYTARFGVLYVQGRVTAGATATTNVAVIPAGYRPEKTMRGGISVWEFGGGATFARLFHDTGVLQIGVSPTSGRTYGFNFSCPYKFFLEW